MKVIYTLESVDKDGASIYLAGPSYRPGEEGISWRGISWREEAIDYLKELEFRGIVFVPEFRDKSLEEWTLSRQISWELEAMEAATVILFWIPRNLELLPGFTTNIEFGEWMKSGKLVVGAPKYAVKNEYILERCSRLGIPTFDMLSSCVSKAVEKTKGERNRIWFTGDTHFGSARTLELSKRPFKNVVEMDDKIVHRWNSVVGKDDEVYHVGDFGDPKILERLNGRYIYLVLGNYDTEEITKELVKNERVYLMESGKSVWMEEVEYKVVHEPMKAKEEGFYLFGHIHRLQMVKRNGLNVGADCHDFTPVSEEAVRFYYEAIKKHYDENVFVQELGKTL